MEVEPVLLILDWVAELSCFLLLFDAARNKRGINLVSLELLYATRLCGLKPKQTAWHQSLAKQQQCEIKLHPTSL